MICIWKVFNNHILSSRRYTCEGYFQRMTKKKVAYTLRQFSWLELSQGRESLLLMGEKLIVIQMCMSHPEQAFK